MGKKLTKEILTKEHIAEILLINIGTMLAACIDILISHQAERTGSKSGVIGLNKAIEMVVESDFKHIGKDLANYGYSNYGELIDAIIDMKIDGLSNELDFFKNKKTIINASKISLKNGGIFKKSVFYGSLAPLDIFGDIAKDVQKVLKNKKLTFGVEIGTFGRATSIDIDDKIFYESKFADDDFWDDGTNEYYEFHELSDLGQNFTKKAFKFWDSSIEFLSAVKWQIK